MRPALLPRRERHPSRQARLLLTASLAGLAGLSISHVASADPGDACVTSYEEAQQARNSGELVRSKANLRLCMKSCPQALVRDCDGWLQDVEQSIGHLDLRAEGAGGAPLRNARLTVDGVPRPFNEKIEIDPGGHEVRVDADDKQPAVARITVAPGATIQHTFRLEAPRTSARRGRHEPALAGPIILGIAGLLVMTVAGGLTIAGHVDVSKMRDSCAPTCSDHRVETVRSLWTAAGILAGAGGAAVVGSGIWLGLELSEGGPAKASFGLRFSF